MTPKTLEAHSIPIPPHLSGRLKQTLGRSGTGFDEGAFLQQLHYWTVNSQTTGWLIDGIKWIYNSLKAWQDQFPWMSEYGLRKAIANLKKLGLIHTAQHWISQYKRVMFYRIDYEKLHAFADNLCDFSTHGCANSDQLDVRTDHTSSTDTTSNISFSKQQTVVVSFVDSEIAQNRVPDPGDRPGFVEQPTPAREDHFSAPGSGETVEIQAPEFPELLELADEVAQAVGQAPGSTLPKNLRRAIAQFPQRVKGAIAYLHHQQQKRSIPNPIGYLYEAIVSGWSLSPQASLLPEGFNQWFEQAKRQGLVVAAMAIDGTHHTLHSQLGWMPTTQLMQQHPN